MFRGGLSPPLTGGRKFISHHYIFWVLVHYYPFAYHNFHSPARHLFSLACQSPTFSKCRVPYLPPPRNGGRFLNPILNFEQPISPAPSTFPPPPSLSPPPIRICVLLPILQIFFNRTSLFSPPASPFHFFPGSNPPFSVKILRATVSPSTPFCRHRLLFNIPLEKPSSSHGVPDPQPLLNPSPPVGMVNGRL